MNTRGLDHIARAALREDKAWEDVTTRTLPASKKNARAIIVAREEGVLAGLPIARAVFKARDPRVRFARSLRDGMSLKPGRAVLEIRGAFGSILAAERTALNFLCRLSGIATLTRRFVEAVKGTGARIYDTRKTTPGLRFLEKEAVNAGGGINHRIDLSSAVLLKDNHLAAARRQGLTMKQCVQRLRRRNGSSRSVEVEAQSLDEAWEAIAAGVDVILLDNLKAPELKKALELIRAVRQVRGGIRPTAEVSGGVGLSNVRALAALGPDRISVGMITHSAPALDLNLDFKD